MVRSPAQGAKHQHAADPAFQKDVRRELHIGRVLHRIMPDDLHILPVRVDAQHVLLHGVEISQKDVRRHADPVQDLQTGISRGNTETAAAA